jgi:Na+-driven multidrug efflux pump/anti-sigma regulatory factor (Ser/Thr protein kinase)
MQLTVTVDAIIVGHFVGRDALAAISLVMPLTMVVSALSTLIGVGPAIIASKAIGNRDFEKVNKVFTSAICQAFTIGGCIGVGCWGFSSEIASFICSNSNLLPYLESYLQVLSWGFVLTILVSTLVSLIEADGYPGLAAKATMAGCLWHVCLEVFCVGYLDMGIQGVAYAVIGNNLLVIALFALRMGKQGASYRWQWPMKSIGNVTVAGLKEGMPMMINDLMYSLMLFLLNGLVGMYMGNQGLFHWAICVQLIMIVLFVVDVAEGAVLSIGSMLIGEKDSNGFSMLVYRLVFMIVGLAGAVTLVVCCFPNEVAALFSNMDVSAQWPLAVRVFSLMLVPHALSVFLRSFFQVLERRWMGMLFSFLQTLCMVTGLWAFLCWAPYSAWWSFPISAFLLLAMQVVFICVLWRKHYNHRLLPVEDSDGRQEFELSVEYDIGAVSDAVCQVSRFLEHCGLSAAQIMAVNICCEELMLNIVCHQSHKNNPYMDLYIAVGGKKICIILKDAGRPFNPVLPTSRNTLESFDEKLGLALVNNVCTTLSHKYMYGQNVVFAEFIRKEQ